MTSKLMEPRWPGGIAPPAARRTVTPARNTKPVSVAEAIAAVSATVARLETLAKATVAEQSGPMQVRHVVGLCMTPKALDGSGGMVEKIIRTGKRVQPEYAEPMTENDDRRGTGGDVGPGAAQADLARLRAKRQKLQAVIDNPATSDQALRAAQGELIKVVEEIHALEVATGPRLDTHK